MADSFGARSTLDVAGTSYQMFRLDALADEFDLSRLPFSLKVLLENLLRFEDGINVTADDVRALAGWDPQAKPDTEIAFTPGRVLLQDFTGVPAVVDLAAMRDAMKALGGDPTKINPLSPAELVIDHSVQVDEFNKADAMDINARIEFERNQERYEFLRWGQTAFSNFRVVPPDTGIVHQVNLEYLARVVMAEDMDGTKTAFWDTVVGTDSHTTMINGLGVLGWGVGGIEAEAAMLGQPVTMLIPQVVGMRLTGKLPEGTTATDLVLTVVEILRNHGVVGKFVEFCGEGLDQLPLADRATLANMAPEYGATCGIFPVDAETIAYLKLSGRSDEQIALAESYAREQGMYRDADTPEPQFSELLTLDMSTVEPSLSGPRRPQDRITLKDVPQLFHKELTPMAEARGNGGSADFSHDGESHTLTDGAVVIAAITSCTNTSNPSVMMGAGLVARKAAALGMKTKPWVKTSLAPGSLVVTEYLKKANLLDPLSELGFGIVGYGCTTCIGNSGPLPETVSKAISDGDLVACSVLSGNRNFEGRVHAEVRMNFLASPPLVVAYALAGNMEINVFTDSLGKDKNGNDVFLKDIWPTSQEIADAVSGVDASMFKNNYNDVFAGDSRWAQISVTESEQFNWSNDSTYIKQPPYFEGMTMDVAGIEPISGARALAVLGDSITTDHISPAGAIKADSPAGKFLQERGVPPTGFNSYGSRRGNDDVMVRGTFANIRLRNQMAPGTEGGFTTHQPSGDATTIYDAAQQYKADGVPLIIIAGKEYGNGSSRDWAAKGTRLLGVRAVIVESFERIHRSNLIGMGVLPLEFEAGASAASLGLNGTESFDIDGLVEGTKSVTLIATAADGTTQKISAVVRIDTPKEWEYYLNGGILQYVIRNLVKAA